MDSIRQSLGDIAKRTAMPLFLFAIVLALFLLLSWFMIIPGLTRVEVQGSVLSLEELREHKQNLEQQVLVLQEKRSVFLHPVDHSLYEQIKQIKRERHSFQKLRTAVRAIARQLVPGNTHVVSVHQLTFDAQAHQAEMRGTVHNVGPRSMTVLAQFVKDIQEIPFVTDVEASRFTRLEDENRAFYSPFSLRITFH